MQEEDAITEVEVPEQQTDEIILIDPENFHMKIFPKMRQMKHVKTSSSVVTTMIVLMLMRTQTIQNDVIYVTNVCVLYIVLYNIYLFGVKILIC